MKRKLFAVGFILLIILCCVIFFRYIFIYNKGNQLYERMDYAGAIEQYQNALEANPPHFKECSIRVNLALAMIYNMGPDFAKPENVESSISTLMEARDILLEDGCATDQSDGHSEPAQQLKDEIDDLIEQLQEEEEPPEDPQNPNDPNEDPDNGGGGGTPPIDPQVEQAIQEQLQDIQTSAYDEREEYTQQQNSWNMDVNYDFDLKIW